jgi:hypothetical protein
MLRSQIMQPFRSIRRALRRLEREDILLLILALAAAWYATEFLLRSLPAWLAGLVTRTPQWTVHAVFSLLVISTWLATGRRFRLAVKRRWPKVWNSGTTVTEFLTHSISELIYKLLANPDSSAPRRVRFPLTMTFPASLRDKLEANRIARTEWSADTPNLFADIEWHLRNPNTMGIARDDDGTSVGYFDFAPVSPELLDQLRSGTINEFDLADLILQDDHSCASLRRAEVIYVAGIVSRFKGARARQEVGAFLHWSMARVLAEAVFTRNDDRRVRFVAVAYGGDDSDGSIFCERARMTKMGHVVIEGDPSGEKHTWYELETSLAELRQKNRRLERIMKGRLGHLMVDTRESTLTKQVYVLKGALVEPTVAPSAAPRG